MALWLILIIFVAVLVVRMRTAYPPVPFFITEYRAMKQKNFHDRAQQLQYRAMLAEMRLIAKYGLAVGYAKAKVVSNKALNHRSSRENLYYAAPTKDPLPTMNDMAIWLEHCADPKASIARLAWIEENLDQQHESLTPPW